MSRIRTLDTGAVEMIRAALDQATSGPGDQGNSGPPDPDALALEAIERVSGTEIKNLREIAFALAALYHVRSSREAPLDHFVDEVCDAMESLQSDDLRLSTSQRPEFREKLARLLGAPGLAVITKAADLSGADERTFCHARVLTDLRPVFGAIVEDGPQAMIVIHQLKLTYHHGSSKHEHFHVTLDDGNLQELRILIDRADAKARTLKSAVNNIRIFGTPKD